MPVDLVSQVVTSAVQIPFVVGLLAAFRAVAFAVAVAAETFAVCTFFTVVTAGAAEIAALLLPFAIQMRVSSGAAIPALHVLAIHELVFAAIAGLVVVAVRFGLLFVAMFVRGSSSVFRLVAVVAVSICRQWSPRRVPVVGGFL